MQNTMFMDAQEVASILGTSKAYAYKLIQRLNHELDDKGYITIQGKVNRTFFNQRIYKEEDGANEKNSECIRV